MLWLVCLLAITAFLFACLTAFVHANGFRLAGVGVVSVQVGILFEGKGLRLRIAGIPVTIGPLPLGSAVHSKSLHSGDPADGTVDGKPFESLPRWRAASITIEPFVLLLLGLLMTPWIDLDTVLAVPGHIVAGTLAPRTAAQAMIADYIAMAAASPAETMSRIALWLTVLNLLPIPLQPMGNALMLLAAGHDRRFDRWVHAASYLGLTILLLACASWTYALWIHPAAG